MTPEVREFLLQRLEFLRDELLANHLYERRAGICYAINYNSMGTPLRQPSGDADGNRGFDDSVAQVERRTHVSSATSRR